MLLAASPSPSMASVQVGDHIKVGDGLGSPGGIFHIDDLNIPGSPDFDTFCVEITEFINDTSTFAVENIGLITSQGGKTLSSYSAWLYNRFLDRATNGFTSSFNVTFSSDINALQLAIWLGIGYTPTEIQAHIGSGWYANYSAVLNSKPWQAQFAADTSWTGVGDIRVLNLRKLDANGEYTDYAQDQLVRTPHMPEPTSVLIWSLLTCCVSGLSARRART